MKPAATPLPDFALLRPRGLLFAGLCMALLLPLLFAVMLWYDLQHDNDQAAARGTIVEQAVELRLNDRLRRLADNLDAVAAKSAADANAGAAAVASGSALQDVVVVRAGDAAGRGVDLQGRPADATWLPKPDPESLPSGLAIGQPMRSPATRRWMVPVAWDGRPGLRVGARVDADWFAAILQGYPLGDGSVLNLLHRDGALLARSKSNQAYAGMQLGNTPQFREMMQGRPSGQFVQDSQLDGVRRLIIFQWVPRSKLIVIVGIARDDILAAWWAYAAVSFSIAVFFAALWFWLNRAFARSHGAQERLLRELRLQSARGEEARRIANLGDWTWNLETGELFWSPENFAICGVPPRDGPLRIEEVPGFVHPDDRERMHGYLTRAVTGGPLNETQFRVVRPDGSLRYVYVRAEWADRRPGHRMLRGIQQDITELAAVRERLREAQDQYRFLFEHNPMPMWVFDRDSLRFLAVNDAFVKNYGYAREELLASTILEIRPPEEIEAVRNVARMEASERPQGRIWTHVRRNGSRLRAEIHTRDIDFEGHRARLVLGMDVTERERNQQRFQLIARATNDAIWDWDVEAGTTWRSDSYFAMFGHEREAVAPNLLGWADRIHPEDRLRVTGSVQRGIDSNATEWEERFRFRREDGQYADVLYRGALFRDALGKVVRAVGGMLDITQRNRDEVDLRLLRRAVESTDNGIVIADAREPGLPAVYVNRAFERMSGYGAGELLGSSFRFLEDGGADEQPEIAALRRAIVEQREIRVLLRDRRRDGQMFWNDFYLAPVRDDTGTLTHFVSVQTDVTERQRAQEQLAFRATHDELTGLPNRQLLVDRLQQSLLNAERHGRSIVVLFIDLDDFKLINDSLGHTAGDETLRLVARRLEEAVADTDTVARFGGDEFAILLTEHTDDRSVALAITCVNAALARPFDLSGSSHFISASIGWCRSPDAGTLAETLLMHADLAMYKAKQGGRNRVVAYQPSFDGQVSARLRLVSELRLAIDREEFVLEFQPIFGVGGMPVALEALVRWNHPERGMLPPGHFIGVAEESGLIVALGRWVLNEAARHHAMLAAHGFGLMRIAVNISSLHFQQDLYSDVEMAMRLNGLPPGILEIELTESVIMENPDAAIDVMRRLDELGVSISVDDFGTGYSSLSYLKRLRIDRLKIDRSFVRDLATDSDDAAICTSIIRLAHSLGLRTVAEGVETQEQLDWLRERGCDEVQGFLLAQPLPFEEMVAELRRPVVV